MGQLIKISFFWLLLAAITMPLTVQAELASFEGGLAVDRYKADGKWLVVMIWASNCPICNREIDSYVEFHETHKGDDARVLGISLDGNSGKKAARDFMQRHAVTFPSLIGEPLEVAAMYSDQTGLSFRGTPTFLVYNPKGELSAQQVGAVPTELIVHHIENN